MGVSGWRAGHGGGAGTLRLRVDIHPAVSKGSCSPPSVDGSPQQAFSWLHSPALARLLGGRERPRRVRPPLTPQSLLAGLTGTLWDAPTPRGVPPQGTRWPALAQRCQLPRTVVCLSEMLLVKPGSGLASEVTEHEDRLPLRHMATQQRQWRGGAWQLSRFWNVLSHGGQAWPSGPCTPHETSDKILKP